MATKAEIAEIVLPDYIEKKVETIYEKAFDSGPYGEIGRRLKDFVVDAVIGDEDIHPVAKASLIASVSTSLVDVTDSKRYQPASATKRKLAAMRAFMNGVRPNSAVLMSDSKAFRHSANPRLEARYSAEGESYVHLSSEVSYSLDAFADVRISSDDPCDFIILRTLPGSYATQENGLSLALDGTSSSSQNALKWLTGVDPYSNSRIRRTIKPGIAQDKAIPLAIQNLSLGDVDTPADPVRTLKAALAIKSIDNKHPIKLQGVEYLKEKLQNEISRVIGSLAAKGMFTEGVYRTEKCCPGHGDYTRFIERKNCISSWSIEQMAVVMSCLNLTVADVKPEARKITIESTLQEVISEITDHHAINDVMHELELRLDSLL